MKVLIVPDVHGRTFWRKARELVDQYKKIVFLGDYLDPYGDEGIDYRQAINELKDIIAFKKEYPDKITLLLGNHDLHYYWPGFIESTRFHKWMAQEITQIYWDNEDLFEIFMKIRSKGTNYIFSHAGINKEWLKRNKLSLTKLLKMTKRDILEQGGVIYGGVLEQVSFYRGGLEPYGSPVWADIDEASTGNFKLGESTLQIVGHNRVPSIISHPGIQYTDCMGLIELDTKTKQLKKS